MKKTAPASKRAAQPTRVLQFDTLLEAALVADIFVLLAQASSAGLPPTLVRVAAHEAVNLFFPAKDTLPEFKAWLVTQGVVL